jgi:hypothetical protein
MTRMRRCLGILTVAALLGLAPAAPVSARVWVRGPVAQAGMIAVVIGDGTDPIQILSRRCANVREETGCARIPVRLRHAVEDAVAAPIVWVHRAWPNGGVYWVLAPFAWRGDRARLRYTWREPAPFGCNGGGRSVFTLIGGTWDQASSSGYAGCP